MDDLIAFFTARLDEEEAMLDASDAADSLHRWLDGDQTTIDLVDRFADSERLHRDIAAKREALRMHGVGPLDAVRADSRALAPRPRKGDTGHGHGLE